MTRPRWRHAFALLAIPTTLLALIGAAPQAAVADSAPTTATTPTTVTTDVLPTVQVDGVVWTQIIVGNTVFVGGSFANAYPAGSPIGTGGTPRSNVLAYDLATGVLVPGFSATVNGEVRALAASADGRTVYIGGAFTKVDGTAENGVAALDSSTGALRRGFAGKANSGVFALALRGSTLYAGGQFTRIGSTTRSRVAAMNAATGAATAWKATVSDGRVRALALSPDGTHLVLGGSFSKVDGSTQRGLAMVDTKTGTKALGFATNSVIQDYGTNSSILSLWSDASGVYGSGYVYGTPGNFEGAFRATWSGTLTWMEDCHGDTYSVAVLNSVAYTASHAHYCGNVPGGFLQTRKTATPSIHQHALAFTASVQGKVSTDIPSGYTDFTGRPAPALLAWYPEFKVGTVTGMSQAAWSVTAGNGYVLYGGEFPKVDGVAQAGLVRFALPGIAPNTQGPKAAGSAWVPTAASQGAGSVHVAWQTNYDRDNETLTYRLYRDGALIATTAAASDGWWNRPYLGFVDTGLQPGSTPTYSVTASDAFGNTATSAKVSTVVGGTDPSAYAQAVLASGAAHYWRFDEPAGSGTTNDWAGGTPLQVGPGVTTGASGGIANDADGAAGFSGTDTGVAVMNELDPAPNSFSVEAWFNTTSTTGGAIVGYGNMTTGASEWYDRTVSMTTGGQLRFEVAAGAKQVISGTKAYNDGRWHQVVASLGAGGMQLSVDGALIASNTKVTSGSKYVGYWHVGGNPTWNGTQYFAGSIDDVALYPAALPAMTVAAHWKLGSTVIPTPTPTPVAQNPTPTPTPTSDGTTPTTTPTPTSDPATTDPTSPTTTPTPTPTPDPTTPTTDPTTPTTDPTQATDPAAPASDPTATTTPAPTDPAATGTPPPTGDPAPTAG